MPDENENENVHVHRHVMLCTCFPLALEPDERCEIHGGYNPPLRCDECGQFYRKADDTGRSDS